MNRRQLVGALMVALAVVLTAGVLYASNMGFKLNYTLSGPSAGVSKSGRIPIALPDNKQAGVNTAFDLMTDIGFASVEQIQRFIKSSETLGLYTGRPPTPASANFALDPGVAYYVKMKTATQYIIVGSDDPALSTTLNQTAAGVSKSGRNFFAYNYHQTAANAFDLMTDVGFASVEQIQRFIKSSETLGLYTGRPPTPASANFSLTPGEGYFIKMKTTTAYTPSHY